MAAYRSVSVPITLNDLERRDAGSQFFRRIYVIRLYRLTWNDRTWQDNMCRRGVFLRGQQSRPHPEQAEHQRPHNFSRMLPEPIPFDVDRPIRYGDAWGHVSTGSGTISIQRDWATATPNFSHILHAPTQYGTQQRNFAWRS